MNRSDVAASLARGGNEHSSPSAAIAKPAVLLVGAFERDNFGDLLFLHVTESYLGRAVVLASSLSQANMALLGRFIYPYSVALEARKFDTVWVAGGEVGTPNAQNALRSSIRPDEFTTIMNSLPDDAARLQRVLMGSVPANSAYVPDLRRFPLNAGTPLVVNSAGISRIETHPDARHDDLLEGLRRAAGLSVRDSPSSSVLTAHGIGHQLNPDLIQTISLMKPLERHGPSAGSMIVQASTSFLDVVGRETFAAEIAVVARANGLPITLFAAGVAPGHDSYVDYEELKAVIGKLQPTVPVSILRERDPWILASAIKSGAVWVGTSLHGRIIAAAFDRPRVSLVSAKVSGYAETWDNDMPHSVDVSDLPAAAALALSPSLAATTAVGKDLAQQAHRSMKELVSTYV